jgi:hypothetical protein
MLPQIIATAYTFADGCVLSAIVTTAIVGSIALIYIDRLKERQDDERANAYGAGYRVGKLDGKRLGMRCAREIAMEEIASRPWQTVAPVHITANIAPEASEELGVGSHL